MPISTEIDVLGTDWCGAEIVRGPASRWISLRGRAPLFRAAPETSGLAIVQTSRAEPHSCGSPPLQWYFQSPCTHIERFVGSAAGLYLSGREDLVVHRQPHLLRRKL